MRQHPRIKIGLPTVVFIIALLILDKSLLSILTLAAALCHELGHIAVMLVSGMEVSEIEITVFGAEIRTPCNSRTALVNIAVFSAGAVANILCAVVVFILPTPPLEAVFFANASLSLAIVNLLPIRTLDGGCILETLLISISPKHMPMIVDIVSCITLGILWLTAVYLLLTCGGNLSLMLFCIYLFVTLLF
ncbi:MAG: site-2 protease family protein [Clostridia bacterium]|nr:site-2 protease family protein [Clostridia bacterium]